MEKILQDLDNLIAGVEQLPRTTFTGSAISELRAAKINLEAQASIPVSIESIPSTP